jgi:hypothetical protein
MIDPKPSADDVSNAADMSAASAKRPFNPDSGEDEGGAPDGGDNRELHDDQKPITGNSAGSSGDDGDDPHKTENLTKAGRDIDPDDGSE